MNAQQKLRMLRYPTAVLVNTLLSLRKFVSTNPVITRGKAELHIFQKKFKSFKKNRAPPTKKEVNKISRLFEK